MKINWWSNAPWASTGYGNQTRLFTKRIHALGYPMSITANYGLQGGRLMDGDIPIYPIVKHPFALDVMNEHAIHAGADCIISLFDIWPIDIQLDLPWFPWFPIDNEPIPTPVLRVAHSATNGITMSRFGQRMAANSGLNTWYVPHGVETNIFKPVDRIEARKRLNLPQNAFIVGMVAANKGNPPRKAFFEQITAFAALKRKHADALLYLHTDDGTHGGDVVNLPQFCQRVGLRFGVDVLFVDQYSYALGLQYPYMVDLYNAFDVLSMVSLGEGFGIPLIEAQACGCPVITGDWTSMSELCFGGWKVDKKEAHPIYSDRMDAFQYIPDAGAIAERMEAAYDVRDNDEYRKFAREGALYYDADTILERDWKPVLAEMEEIINANKGDTANINTAVHVHDWASIGLFNGDNTMSVPCKDPHCYAELVIDKTGNKTVKQGGFSTVINGIALDIEDDPNGGVEKIICREIDRDYGMKSLDIKAGDRVLDIGAQVGIVSCYLAKQYPGIKIEAYEPIKENFDRLIRNVKTNGVEVEAHIEAVTADGRDIVLHGDLSTNSGGVSMFGTGTKYTAKSVSIDELLKEPVKLLKIDCEGAEYEILQRAIETGSIKNVAMIRGEFHAVDGKDPRLLLDMVKAHVPDTIVTLQGVKA